MTELLLSTIVVSVNDKRLGIKLKQARLESGLSQEEVAVKLGVTWEMISRYENGRSSPLKHMKKLVGIYNKPISFFMSEEGEEDSFKIDDLVQKLKDEGIGYHSNSKNVVKVIETFSGKGIENDLAKSGNFYEIATNLTEQYPDLYAFRFNKSNLEKISELHPNDIGLFAPGLTPKKGDIVIAFDGVNYKIKKYTPGDLFTPLSVLISLERKFRD